MYEYVTSPTRAPADDAMHDVVALEAHGPLEPEEEQHDEKGLRRRFDRHPPELEEPRGEPGEHDDDRRHESARREPEGEHPQQQDRRENERRGYSARDLLIGPGELEDTGEQVRVDRALVVVERAEEERESSPVLVAKPGRQRVAIE